MSVNSIANLSETAACALVANKFATAGKFGLQAVLYGVIVLREKPTDDKKSLSRIKEGLFRALMGAEFTQATCNKYVSLMTTAATKEFFPWSVDVNATVQENCKAIFPEFATFWRNSMQNIKQGGPYDKEKVARKPREPKVEPVATAEPATDTVVELVQPVNRLDNVFASISTADILAEIKRRVDSVDTADLLILSAEIDAVISFRATEATELDLAA